MLANMLDGLILRAKKILFGRLSLLIGAVNVATLLLGTLVVGLYIAAFPPLSGWSEATTERITGWVVNRAAPMNPVEVQLYIDGRFTSSQKANLARPDVVATGRARFAECGFSFDLPPLAAGKHEALVYAMHKSSIGSNRTQQQVGRSLRFTVERSND